jgi:hypothetical protein
MMFLLWNVSNTEEHTWDLSLSNCDDVEEKRAQVEGKRCDLR